ncbi:MAG: DMT family transporter [Cyanobacteria bacterium P01_C01_bin.72]
MLNSLLTRSNPQVTLILSRALAAARPAILAFLITQGDRLGGESKVPVSFCNVLFVGNLCSAIAVCLFFDFRTIVRDLQSLENKILWGLFVNGCLAAVLSSLIFLGLKETSVTNAVLIGRFGPVLYAVIGSFILGNKLGKLELFGFALIVVGIGVITLKESNFQLNQGDALILLSTLAYTCTALIGRIALSGKCSLEVVVFTRNFISSVFFFIIAMSLFGFSHFMDIFSGQLWIVMSVYGLFVVVLAQLMWYSALKRLDSKTVGSLTALSPIFSIFYAFVLNGELPTQVQLSALAVIFVGLLISNLGKKRSPKSESELAKMPTMESTASGS